MSLLPLSNARFLSLPLNPCKVKLPEILAYAHLPAKISTICCHPVIMRIFKELFNLFSLQNSLFILHLTDNIFTCVTALRVNTSKYSQSTHSKMPEHVPPCFPQRDAEVPSLCDHITVFVFPHKSSFLSRETRLLN